MYNIHQAMNNTYNILMGYRTLKDLVLKNEGYFIFNPEEPVSLKTLETLLNYFADEEEYDKCIEIKKLIKDGEIIGRDLRKN
tara:strand:+ start:8112 stop:8357 length:246 start_codon:yes stop_codon:yes gene_type:complete